MIKRAKTSVAAVGGADFNALNIVLITRIASGKPTTLIQNELPLIVGNTR